MSTLYKEALIEAKKLRELAEQDAKKKILEELSPLIKKSINEQLGADEVSESFFTEDSVSEEPVNLNGDKANIEDINDSEGDITGLNNQQTGSLGDESGNAPISVRGSEEENIMSATMPGADGKITVDFEDLFSSNNTKTPLEMPIQVSPEDSIVSQDTFKEDLLQIENKITESFYKNNLSILGKETLQQKLFNLLENLDFLKESNIINEKEAIKNENKLNYLFLKLKESKVSNSYIKDNQEDINIMPSLKEYAARLFEEDTSHVDAGQAKLNQKSTASDEHAKKQSGVSPEVGNTSDLKAQTPKQNSKSVPTNGWDEAEPELKEEVDVKASSGFGDDKDASVEFDISDTELNEAIKNLTEESVESVVKPKVDKKEGWENAEPEEKNPSHANLKEDAGEEMIVDPSADPLAGTDPLETEELSEPDLILNIELPAEIQDALANIDVSQIGVDVDVPGATGAAGDLDLDDEMELDFNLDDDDDSVVDSLEAPEADPIEDDEEMKESYMKMKEAFVKLQKANKLLESKVSQLQTENSSLKETAIKHKENLKEANLFLAKNIYFTKCLQRGDVSQKNLQHIVEYLDRAKTVKDAKKIYSMIKTKLQESANASRKLTGSPSQVTTSGGNANTKQLNESKSVQGQESDPVIDTNRWAYLAKIKKAD